MPALTPSSKPVSTGSTVKSTTVPAVASPAARSKLNWLLIGGGVAALAVVVAAFFFWRSANEPPRLNSSTVEIAKFAASPRFDSLPLGEQRKYMDVLEGRKDDLKAAYEAGQITEAEYRTAKELSWFSDWLGRMDEYYAKPPGQQRQDYLNALAAKQAQKDEEKEEEKASKGNDKGGGSKLPKVKRDEASEELRPKQWTAEEQKRWNEFRSAYRQVKEAREKAAREQPEKAGARLPE